MTTSVGNQLKQARQARGWSLEQASHITRIRVHYLEALEGEDRTVLPSPVQGRGFLRLYAGHLGLPVEALVDQWEGRMAAASIVPVETLPKQEQPGPAEEAEAPSVSPAEFVEDVPLPEEEVIEETTADLPEPSEQDGSSRAIFVEIGQTLRKQREILSLSLDDVEKFTHLRLHYLKALEAGALDQLPSPVQARGMLSNYATFLNLDSEKVLLRFADGLQTRRSERLPPPPPSPRGARTVPPRGAKPASAVRRLLTPDLIFAGVLLISLFVLLLWGAANIGILDQAGSSPTLPSVGEVLLTTPSITPLLTENVEGTLPADAQTAVPTGEVLETLAPTLAPMNSDPLQVYVVARRRSFLRITVDGELKYNGRIIPGNAYPFSGKQSIELISGNAAAIQVFYNQQDMGTLGTLGQPVSLIFSATGIVTPTLSITLAPTITPPATVTPLPSATIPSPTITPLIP
jgi:cytoskeleton protein RodZ